MAERESNRAARAVRQKLESLQRAGVTHLGKPPHVEKPAAPPAVRAATPAARPAAGAEAAKRAKPSPVPAPPATPPPAPRPPVGSDPRAIQLDQIRQKVAACPRCAELVATRTQTVFGAGNPHARLAFMGEAPGADEDRTGEPFVGAAGRLLTDIITKGMGLRREDVYILNIIKCRPPGNRTPLPVEAAACREYLDGQLSIIQPEFICCLGACAAQNLLQTKTPISRMRGRFHDYNGAKVLCTFHPAYVLRNPPAKKDVWDDIQILMAAMGIPAPKRGG